MTTKSTRSIAEYVAKWCKKKTHHIWPLGACKDTWLLYWKAGCSLDNTGSWDTKRTNISSKLKVWVCIVFFQYGLWPKTHVYHYICIKKAFQALFCFFKFHPHRCCLKKPQNAFASTVTVKSKPKKCPLGEPGCFQSCPTNKVLSELDRLAAGSRGGQVRLCVLNVAAMSEDSVPLNRSAVTVCIFVSASLDSNNILTTLILTDIASYKEHRNSAQFDIKQR